MQMKISNQFPLSLVIKTPKAMLKIIKMEKKQVIFQLKQNEKSNNPLTLQSDSLSNLILFFLNLVKSVERYCLLSLNTSLSIFQPLERNNLRQEG